MLAETSPSEKRSGLLPGGNWIVDHVKMIDVRPAQDALATISSQTDGNGGGPYNVTKIFPSSAAFFRSRALA